MTEELILAAKIAQKKKQKQNLFLRAAAISDDWWIAICLQVWKSYGWCEMAVELIRSAKQLRDKD